MKRKVTPFSQNQTMSQNMIEVYHYRDISLEYVMPHVHEHYEFFFFINGSAQYTVNNQMFAMQKGDFLIIPPKTLHFPNKIIKDRDNPYERIVLWVNKNFYETILNSDQSLELLSQESELKNLLHIRPDVTSFGNLQEVLNDILLETENKELSYQLALRGLFLQLLACMNRCIQNKTLLQKHDTSHDQYSRIISFIHENITKQVTVKEIAAHFYISTSYVSKLFREHLGISAYQYIIRLKLERTLQEIAHGSSLADASLQYGFNDYSCFYRHFKKEFGVSPSTVLKGNKKN